MERLLTQTRFVNRILVILLLVISLSFMAKSSAYFQDQVPKLVTSENYYTNLRIFHGESLTAMSLSSMDRRELFLGGKNTFYIMNLTQPFGRPSAVTNVTWVSRNTYINSCTMKGKQGWQCQNFIQVVLRNNATNRLMVCGTNAWAPQCRNYQEGSLSDYDSIPGSFRCPFSPRQRSTAIFADGVLYTATVTSFTAVDSAIFRSLKGNAIRSKEVDTKWLKVPEFINSFEIGDWVMFFFQEIAVEHVNSGEVIYSRVAKVCKSDIGGGYFAEETFTTFQKALLNCSFPGAFPFYFNYLQDVYKVGEGENTTFYGVFTTGKHEIPGSAVCAFSLTTIKDIFDNGQFKQQRSGIWYPVPADEVPDQRPGDCSVNSDLQPGETVNFILSHPLMHQSVPNKGDGWPQFDVTRSDSRLVQLVVHQQVAANGKTYDVVFLGTDDGRVLKTVLVKDSEGRYSSNHLEDIYVSPRDQPEAVVNMEIIRNAENQEVILVNTNSTVVELPLQRCQNLSKCACLQDPYCVLNNFSEMCIPYTGNNAFDSQDVETIKDCPKEVPVPQTTTPVECFCPTTQPCVSTDLTTTMVPTTTTASTTRTTTSPRPPLKTTPNKGTPTETTEGLDYPMPSTSPRLLMTTMRNEIPQGKITTPKRTVSIPNGIDPSFGGSIAKPQTAEGTIFWTFFAIGWLIAFVLVVFIFHIYFTKRCKDFKPSPNIVKTVLPTENGKPPLMTSMQESPIKAMPSNGSLPQSRTHSLTPSSDHISPYTEPNGRNSSGSYRPPNGSFSYGVDNSFLTPYQRQPTTGGVPSELSRLPSESESRPSASGASDSEIYGDDSEVWLKRPDGTDFGQEHEV